MKKWLVTSLILIFGICSLQVLSGQEMRIYNDGIIDYVPMTASFVLSADDYESSLKEIQYSVDGSALQVYNGPISFSTEGRHVIVYRAIDRTDNISSEQIYSVFVDGTPPDGLASVDGPLFIDGNKIYISPRSAIVLWAEDNLSGVDTIYVSLDGGGYIAYTEPMTIDRDGRHSATAYAVDNVGNKTAEFKVEGYVDSTPPVVRITPKDQFVIVDGKNYTNRSNEYEISAYDNLAGVRNILVSLDGSEYVAYTSPFMVQAPGQHVLRAKAVDNLGNESSFRELVFFTDVTPPEATMGASVE